MNSLVIDNNSFSLLRTPSVFFRFIKKVKRLKLTLLVTDDLIKEILSSDLELAIELTKVLKKIFNKLPNTKYLDLLKFQFDWEIQLAQSKYLANKLKVNEAFRIELIRILKCDKSLKELHHELGGIHRIQIDKVKDSAQMLIEHRINYPEQSLTREQKLELLERLKSFSRDTVLLTYYDDFKDWVNKNSSDNIDCGQIIKRQDRYKFLLTYFFLWKYSEIQFQIEGSESGEKNIAKRLKNDVVDISYEAYAVHSQFLITEDGKVRRREKFLNNEKITYFKTMGLLEFLDLKK